MDIIFTKCSNNRQNKIVQRILKPDNLKENTDYTSILGNNSNYLPLKEYYREKYFKSPFDVFIDQRWYRWTFWYIFVCFSRRTSNWYYKNVLLVIHSGIHSSGSTISNKLQVYGVTLSIFAVVSPMFYILLEKRVTCYMSNLWITFMNYPERY